MILQRNSTFYYLVMAVFGVLLLGSIANFMLELGNSGEIISAIALFLIVSGALLWVLGLTEEKKDLSKILIIISTILYFIGFFLTSYHYFQTNQRITAIFFALVAFLLLVICGIYICKRGTGLCKSKKD